MGPILLWGCGDGSPSRPRVVVVGAGFGGLAVARRAPRPGRRRDPDRRQQLPHLPAAAVPGGDRRAGLRERRLRDPRHRPSRPTAGRQRRRAHGPGDGRRPRAADRQPRRQRPARVRRARRRRRSRLAPLRRPWRRRARLPAQAPRRRPRHSGPRARPLRARRGRPAGRCSAGALDVVVCGGGPTGVEMAGGLRELYTRVLAKDFPQLPVDDGRASCSSRWPTACSPRSHRSPSARARRTLERRGVEVLLGVGVAAVDAGEVHLVDGTAIPAHTTVWATGVTADPLAATLGTPTGRGGRLVVEPDLSAARPARGLRRRRHRRVARP